jgi:hypothetical protein
MSVLKSIALAYDPKADRILAAINPGHPDAWSCWLTRRLVLEMLVRVSLFLEKTSVLAQQAPADYRREIVMVEQETALATTARLMTKTANNVIRESAASAELADRLTISVLKNGYKLDVRGDRGGKVMGVLRRAELQRVIRMLEREVARGDWLTGRAKLESLTSTAANVTKGVRH